MHNGRCGFNGCSVAAPARRSSIGGTCSGWASRSTTRGLDSQLPDDRAVWWARSRRMSSNSAGAMYRLIGQRYRAWSHVFVRSLLLCCCGGCCGGCCCRRVVVAVLLVVAVVVLAVGIIIDVILVVVVVVLLWWLLWWLLLSPCR